VLQILSSRGVVEVDGIGCEIRAVVVRGQYCFKDASAAEGCREVAADVEGYRVGGCGRLGSTFGSKMLCEG
jgi:hypothetical protein